VPSEVAYTGPTVPVAAILACVIVLGAFALITSAPRRERVARRRSTARAEEVASALGLVAEQDPEVPTTYHLRAASGGQDVKLSMGSPAFPRGLIRTVHGDWMMARATGDPRWPEGARIRPPRRTVFEWRDGLPGEAPTLVTPRGMEIVVEEGPGELVDVGAILAWVDTLPEGVWVVEASRDVVVLRARDAAVRDAREGARTLFELVRFS
jgi:hypothetical protein